MFWPPFVFNLCIGLLLAAYLLRAVRRFERTADRIMTKIDQWHAEELRKYDVARDEIRASMRAQVDARRRHGSDPEQQDQSRECSHADEQNAADGWLPRGCAEQLCCAANAGGLL